MRQIAIRNNCADIISIKYNAKYPVPHVSELREFFKLFPEFHPYLIAMGFIAAQGARPSEVVNLYWRDFKFNAENTEIIETNHMAYKARNTMLKSGKVKVTFKELKKPMYSKWLSYQIMKYREYNGECYGGKVFPFTTTDVLNKFLTKARAKYATTHPFLVDPNTYPIKGQDRTIHRFNLYALRRFSFTFHWWITYGQDSISLAYDFGHSRSQTTHNHYIYPKEAIGLTDEMIRNKITFDEFVFGRGSNQTSLTQYTAAEPIKPIRQPGQRSLSNYLPFSEPIRRSQLETRSVCHSSFNFQ